jgi:hypothetical protein
MFVIAEILLGQGDEHLLGADRIVEGVEGEHFFPPINIHVRANIQQSGR